HSRCRLTGRVHRALTTLIERADAYREADKIQPLDARLKRKDELAAQMAAEINKMGVSRDALGTTRHIGIGVALAAAVLGSGEPGDLQTLAKLLPLENWPPHARYRLVHAVTKAIERQTHLRPEDVNDARRILDDIERMRGADLPRAAQNVRDLL